MSKKRIGSALLALLLLLSMAFSGCGASNTADESTTTVPGAVEPSGDPLEEITEIPEDGIITAEQMATIAGQEGIWHFVGEADDIAYDWAYDGSKLLNPVEQNLKLSFDADTEEVQEAANEAPYGIGVTIADMELAAPPTLTLTLPEKWEADKVLYCIYEEDELYQLSDAVIETVESDAGEEVSEISFTVPKTGGTFYVLGGSTKSTTIDADEEDSVSDSSDDQTDTDSSTSKKSGGSKKSGKSGTMTCTISISCKSILSNMDKLDSAKADFVPDNGWILKKTTVEISNGDTVFDVLKAVCKATGIQMESEYTPVYGSYYVSGINQLYEFDCGESSGWMYKVNGWAPNYGCAEYKVSDGDVISWEYTCTLGSDL